ncbi:DUF2125 domain-containing protein [Yoonia sp.]|uniref:DUF2125 domain-containing protein n=1 Tax=Yoonia sp. TaxID=2212373 RepID=UPI0025EB5574|nr:DUF2125 domain-containing protein [Yoonia sp.]
MRRLTFLVGLLAALYSGYWVLGAFAVKQGAATQISAAQRDGWGVAYRDLQLRGFPSRFDTTASDLVLTSPDGLWSWAAPFVQVFALSYRPNRVIVAFPNDQTLRFGDQNMRITGDRLRASAGVAANTDLSFDAVTLDAAATTVVSDFGWTAGLDRAIAAMRAKPGAGNSYDIYVDADQLTLPATALHRIDPQARLPQTITRIALDSTVTLDRALDRHAFDGQNSLPVAQRVVLNSFVLDWGDLGVRADGAVDIDALGVLNGRVTVRTAQWREIIALLVSAGAIDPGVAPTVVNVVATMAPDGQMLELPIMFRDGFVWVGPLPVGPAPRLR